MLAKLARALAIVAVLSNAVDAQAKLVGPVPRVSLQRATATRLASSKAAPSPEQLLELQAARARLIGELDEVELEIAAAVKQLQPPSEPVEGRPSTIAEAFDPNFGYISKSAGNYADTTGDIDGPGGVPTGFVDLAARNFLRELPEALSAFGDLFGCLAQPPGAAFGRKRRQVASVAKEVCSVVLSDVLAPDKDGSDAQLRCVADATRVRAKLRQLRLSNDAIWAREERRPQVEAPWVLLAPYYALCWVLDAFFDGRPISRFWFLETVARMPYFSYISLLHLYESLGWWRRSAELKRVHFAEEWNEYHHLLIMESLGGDQRWVDRFFAHHAAIAYFWILVGLWLLSPSLSYNFSELIEAHAVDTYGEFVDANAEALKQLPAPRIAKLYYGGSDMYLFDEFQTARPRGSRRVSVSTLYDVFSAIRDDEAEHVGTMRACKDPRVIVRAPQVERGVVAAVATGAAVASAFSSGIFRNGAASSGAEGLDDAALEAASDAADAGASAIADTLGAGTDALGAGAAAAADALGPLLERLAEIFAPGGLG